MDKLMKVGREVIVVLAIIEFAGCDIGRYQPPQFELGSTAVIKESNTEGRATTLLRFMYIDGKYFPGPLDRLNPGQTVVATGPHAITVVVQQKPPGPAGTVRFSLLAKAGETYIFRISYPVVTSEYCATASLWIETASGEVVAQSQKQMMRAVRGGSEIAVRGVPIQIAGRSATCGE